MGISDLDQRLTVIQIKQFRVCCGCFKRNLDARFRGKMSYRMFDQLSKLRVKLERLYEIYAYVVTGIQRGCYEVLCVCPSVLNL